MHDPPSFIACAGSAGDAGLEGMEAVGGPRQFHNDHGYGRTPTIEVTEVSRARINFTLRNSDASTANALRRIMIAEVPTLAVELVTVHENSSVLHDEFLVHRLGLLPINSDRIRQFRYKEDCPCPDRCRNCSAEFQLDVVCTGNQELVVTHLDIRSTDPSEDAPMPVPTEEELLRAQSSSVQAGAAPTAAEAAQGGVVIARLRRNQRIKVDMIAQKGFGKLHAKWIPCATATFQYAPDVRINEKLLEAVPPALQQEIAASCPRGVFESEVDAFTAHTLTVANPGACIFCEECTQFCREKGHDGLIHVGHQPGVFRFTVESTGALHAAEIVKLALEILEDKLSTVLREMGKLSGGGAQLPGHGGGAEDGRFAHWLGDPGRAKDRFSAARTPASPGDSSAHMTDFF